MSRTALLVVALSLTCVTCSRAAEEGLVGHWRFESAGTEVADLSGRGHTAQVAGQFVEEDGRKVLRLDGTGGITLPPAADFHLARGFSVEMRVKPTDLSNGRTLVFKDKEYLLRIDWPVETSRLSFFAHVGGQWESRVSAYKLPPDAWYHVVATWTGLQSLLWVNGQPFQVGRPGDPQPADSPLLIGARTDFGAGFVGSIEYVKVYRRALTGAEVLKAAYGIGDGPREGVVATPAFDFRAGAQGWSARGGATAEPGAAGLAVKTGVSGSLVMHDRLDVDVEQRDYLGVRMAVDKGSKAEIVFATTRGAGRIPFEVFADGAPHTYILEPWQSPGWGGRLMALGLVPSEVEGASARVHYVRVGEEPRGEGDIHVASISTDSVLPRAGRTERLVARVRNAAGKAANVRVTLTVPSGVVLKGSATQSIAALGYLEAKEVAWQVLAKAPVSGRFRVDASAQGAGQSSLSTRIGFLANLRLPRASYVPEPRPAKTGKYTVWTHYCPLWKHGTHYGWKMIEPYPERKPVLGWYNEGTPEVADWHIKYWLEHGISGVVYCWYRSNLNGPVTQSLGHALHDGLLKARYLPRIGFAIMWENGCGKGVGSREDLMQNVLPFWLDNYLAHPSYLKVDGKPVLYIWVPGNVTRDLGGSENVRATFEAMREKARQRGLKGLYIVGCCGGADKASLERMAKEGWDASSAYGNGWVPPAQTKRVGSFYSAPFEGFVGQQERIWKQKNEWNLLPDITAAMMGWDSRPWSASAFFWSENTPEKFRDLCLRARAAMDAKPGSGVDKKTAIFCCWNELGEGHYIEPTRGYGFSYLDAIRDVFTEGPAAHTDVAPEDVGLGPYDSWYRQARKAAPPAGPSAATEWAGDRLAGWGGMMGMAKVEVAGGVLRALTNSTDSALSSPALKVRAGKFTKVVMEVRASRAVGAQLFWSTTTSPHATEMASVHAAVPADGQFHRCVFEVGKSEFWGGCLTSMRLDPADAPDVSLEIRRIALE